MDWNHYACNRCNQTLRTTINNPDNHVTCARCGYKLFNEISKEEYNKARSGK